MALLLLTLPIRSPLPALPGFLEHRGANPMLGGRPEGPRSGAGSGPGPGGHRGPTGARAHLANPLAGEPHRLFCTSTDSLKQAEAFRSHRRAICAYAKSVGFQDTGYGIVTTRLCAGRNGETPWAGLCRLLAPPCPWRSLDSAGVPAVLVARLVVGGIAGVVGPVVALIGHAQAGLAVAFACLEAVFVVVTFGARPGVRALNGFGVGGWQAHKGQAREQQGGAGSQAKEAAHGDVIRDEGLVWS